MCFVVVVVYAVILRIVSIYSWKVFNFVRVESVYMTSFKLRIELFYAEPVSVQFSEWLNDKLLMEYLHTEMIYISNPIKMSLSGNIL